MINGAHAIIYSKDAEADRTFFRDVLRFPHVDVGGGWLIFALPPSELAVHPGDAGDSHELYLMCDDLRQPWPSWRRAASTATLRTVWVGGCGRGLRCRAAAA